MWESARRAAKGRGCSCGRGVFPRKMWDGRERIPEERLRYETACADKGSNILGFIGLAPVTFSYTNVTGGSGCFSGANVSFSPWMKVETGNENL